MGSYDGHESARSEDRKRPPALIEASEERETGILLLNNQRQHRTSHAQTDVPPLRIRASYCAPCQPLLRHFPRWIRSPPPETRRDLEFWERPSFKRPCMHPRRGCV